MAKKQDKCAAWTRQSGFTASAKSVLVKDCNDHEKQVVVARSASSVNDIFNRSAALSYEDCKQSYSTRSMLQKQELKD